MKVLIIGGGPAGLATAQQLGERGIRATIIERGDEVGWVWANLYDSLKLHTGKHLSALPGLPFGKKDPLFITRDRFVEYLRDYAAHFDLDVRTGIEAFDARRNGSLWEVATSGGTFEADHLVVATGIVSNPSLPDFEGLDRYFGNVLHSSEYRRPEPFRDRRVLVVGVGNSGAEIASEISHVARNVTIAVRSGAHVVPLSIAGVPIQYVARGLRKLPRFAREAVVGGVRVMVEWKRGKPVLPRPAHSPLDAIPLIGFHLDEAIREGRVDVGGPIRSFTEKGAAFENGREIEVDDVILATGFRPAIGLLGSAIRTDEKGFANRHDRVRSADTGQLWFVGHNYDSSGGLYNIRIDSALVADGVAASG